MYQHLQQLVRTAAQSNATSQIPLGRGHTVFGELFPLFHVEPGSALQDVVSIAHQRDDFSWQGAEEPRLHWIVFQMLAGAPLDIERSQELVPQAAESLWSGCQREP